MSNKIAKIDAEAMNSLYGAELTRMGVKTAAGVTDTNGAPQDPQAFADHKEYMDTLAEVMREDKKVDGGNPNDPILD
jgi:hypothetical protein